MKKHAQPRLRRYGRSSRWFRVPARPSTAVFAIISLCSVVELFLLATDLGWLGQKGWREIAYAYGAFWRQLLLGVEPIFPLQQVTMYVTYAFLHGGWLHLVVNMIALYSFGNAIVERVGQRGFLISYGVSLLGGSIGFALLSTSLVPMVGASGALFGLLGVWICWDYLERRHYGDPIWITYRALIYLIIYNLVFWLLLSGRLAWETHLGGFIAGWLLALYWGRRIYTDRMRANRETRRDTRE